MHKFKLVIRFLLLSILLGCSSPSIAPAIQPGTEERITPTSPAPTLTTIPSATETTEADFPQDCINANSTAFNPSGFSGFLVVSDSQYNSHLLDPQTKQFLDVDKDGNQTFEPGLLSPNKKYMLAITTAGDSHILRTADKVIRTNMPTSDYWAIPRWLDNGHVSFLSLKSQDVIVLDPFTGKQRSIHLDLPNPKKMRETPTELLPFASIDHTLRRVLYNDQTGRFILWDIESKKEIASLDSPAEELWLDPSAWSPDGATVAIPWPEDSSAEKPLANELYAFGVDGKLQQLTKLNQKYAFANVESPSWSLDGRHIGFWLKIGDIDSNPLELRQWLAVLDIATLEQAIYCISSETQPTQADHIVWSPDGQQLIVNIGRPTKHVAPVLVDLAHKTQSVIDTQNMLVDDWMAP